MAWTGPLKEYKLRQYIISILQAAGVSATVYDSRTNAYDPDEYPFCSVYTNGYTGSRIGRDAKMTEDRNTEIIIVHGNIAINDAAGEEQSNKTTDLILNTILSDNTLFNHNSNNDLLIDFVSSSAEAIREQSHELAHGAVVKIAVSYRFTATEPAGDDFDIAKINLKPIEPNHIDAGGDSTIDKFYDVDQT